MILEVYRATELGESCRLAAAWICETASAMVRKQGRFTLALAGGNTPRLLYEYLAAPPLAARMPWENIYVFFGDERWVGPAHHFSNFAMANASLLARVEIPGANILRMLTTELASLQAAADSYEETLTRFFGPLSAETQRPGADGTTAGLDLVILGMGEDGHTASLFPGSEALAITGRRVAAVWPRQASPPLPRLTLTLPAINSASQVLCLVAGARKLAIVQAILDNPAEAGRLYPAACIRPQDRLIWYLADG